MQTNEDRPPVWCAVVMDESGSMESAKDGTISGFNEYLQDRQDDAKNVPVWIWLTKFNIDKTIMYNGVDAREVKPLTKETYTPRGGTALLDAVGSTIFSIEARLAEQKVQPKVIVMIMTDGEENASRFFASQNIKELIRVKTAEGNWTFTYMGANQDSWDVSAKLGISKGNVGNYQTRNAMSAMKGMSKVARSRSFSPAMQNTNSLSFNGGVQAESYEDLADAEVDISTGEMTVKSST